MLLSSCGGFGSLLEGVEDFARDVAFEAAHGFLLGFAVGDAAGDVIAGGLVAVHSHDQDGVQGTIGVAVAAPIESVSYDFAAGGFQGTDAAEFGECCVAMQAVRVVAYSGQQCCCAVRSDTINCPQCRCRCCGEYVDLLS